MQKIAIAGFGLEGRSNFEYFSKLYNHAELTIVDENQNLQNLPPNAKTKLSPNAFSNLEDYEMVVRTAGLSPHKIKTNGKIWSATNEFFQKCPAKIIGVTGTKGKGTTASLIAEILRKQGKKVHLVGNIGTPALNVLGQIQPEDFVVYEMSSFQLWDLERSPTVAVVLMIEPDHLDVHNDFSEYLEAKSHITKYQKSSDSVVYNAQNQFSQQIASQSKGNHLPYNSDQSVAYFTDQEIIFNNQIVCKNSQLQLVGRHNLQNICAALTAINALRLENLDFANLTQAIVNFRGLPHRLQFVGEVQAVRFYDDSIATTAGSLLAAIQTFDQPKILIIGGADKNVDFTEMIQQIKQAKNIKNIILIGKTTEKLAELFQKIAPKIPLQALGIVSMDQIVAQALQSAAAGDVIILSPAAASFDMFRDYKDRGEQFIQAVHNLPQSSKNSNCKNQEAA